MHHLGLRSKSDHPPSRFYGITVLEISNSWSHGRWRETTRWRHSSRLGPPFPPFPLHQLLAVVDLLIDTETHWRSPGTGPNDLDLCTVLYACCCPKLQPPPPPSPSLSLSLIATFNITENILCCVLKMTLKPPDTEVVWLVKDCMKTFCTLKKKKSPEKEVEQPIVEVVTWWWDALFFLYFPFVFGPFEPGLPFTVSRTVPSLFFPSTVSSKFTFRYLLGQKDKKRKEFPHCAPMPACWTHAQPLTIS